MGTFQDYYQTLGVSRSAGADEIKRAYRKLAKEWHPDRHPESERDEVETKFKAIAEAHEVLSDPEKRKRYDALGENWRQGQNFGGRGAGIDPAHFAGAFGGGGFSDFFAQMFGDMFAGGPAQARAPRRGADAKAEIKLAVGEALLGGKRAFAFRTRTPCSVCGGEGWLQTGACPACGGLGASNQQKDIELKIPEDVRDGQVVRLRGLGQAGASGPGDLLLTMRLEDDDVYRSRGQGDVEADVAIAPWDALEDTVVFVTVRGGTARARIPAGTRSGERLRLRGQGLTRPDKSRGDLFLVVRFALPEDLDQEQRDLLAKLAAASKPVRGGAARAEDD